MFFLEEYLKDQIESLNKVTTLSVYNLQTSPVNKGNIIVYNLQTIQ